MGDVSDDEWLHRRVRLNECQRVQPPKRLSSTAFNDKGRKPSVDRAALRPAAETKIDESDGVVRLLTASVRGIGIPIAAPNPPNFEVDVWARILPENAAHAQIEPLPNMGDSRFGKLKEALARLAEQEDWVIEPAP
ncbi:MAG: hypothetical protein ACYCZD_11215 [Rhodanobacter sp.]